MRWSRDGSAISRLCPGLDGDDEGEVWDRKACSTTRFPENLGMGASA